VGKQVPAVKKALQEADGNALLQALQSDGSVTLDLTDGPLKLTGEEIEVRLQARQGWAAAQGPSCVVVLNTEVTDVLRREGIAKDLIRTIQNQRKEIACEYTDRIEVGIVSEDSDVATTLNEHREMICGETLADRLGDAVIEGVDPVDTEYGKVFVKKVSR
jgi:isoleucyl-tRNA synthetase